MMRASVDDIRRFFGLLARPGDVFELRGLAKVNGQQLVTTGFFDDLEQLARTAVDRSGKDDGVYVTINPVNPALLARAPKNRVRRAGSGDTTSDRDVAGRRSLLVDIDPIRPTGISSTTEEHDAALDLADQIRRELIDLGWPTPIFADSGNGAHLIFKVDLPVDDGGLIARALKKLSKQYSTTTLKVDEKVFNPARISKIYGTLTRKGEDTPERPHRVARILAAPAELETLSRSTLEQFAPAEAPPNRNTQAPRTNQTYTAERATFVADEWIATNLPDAKERSWASGRKWIIPVCPFNDSHDRGEAHVEQMHSGAMSAGCLHESCKWTWKDLRKKFEPDAYAWEERQQQTQHHANGTRRIAEREPPPEVVYQDPAYDADIDAFADRDREPAAPTTPTAPKRVGRTWEDCVEEIYARKDEPWIDVRIGTTVIATCRNGSFVPLIAPSGAGKSTLALQMIVDHAVNRGPAVYATYELDGDEAVARAIGQQCSFSWASVLRGEVPRAMVPVVDRLRILERDDATLEKLEASVVELRKAHPNEPVYVVVDYLQATPAPPGKERGYVANVSSDLRRIAKKLRVVLIGISQASTANSKAMRSGELLGIDASATGAETAQIERDAYVILALGDRQPVDHETVSWKLSVAKYRLGTADVVYELHYRGRIGLWEVFGEMRTATEVRDTRDTEAKQKKLEELKRSIRTFVSASQKPVSQKEIVHVSTGKERTVVAAIRELIQEGVLAHVHGSRRGGHALIWTTEKLTQEGEKC